jgi:hypothetical protein
MTYRTTLGWRWAFRTRTRPPFIAANDARRNARAQRNGRRRRVRQGAVQHTVPAFSRLAFSCKFMTRSNDATRDAQARR